MRPPPNTIEDWQARARQNLRAATVLAARHPPLLYPAVSRIYYACFQGAVAALRVHGAAVAEHHGDVWRAAETMTSGLGNALRWLYKWRLRADYATAPISSEKARELVAQYATTCRSLGITEEIP